jgi:O-antigen/teichoic acid export membrane protein
VIAGESHAERVADATNLARGSSLSLFGGVAGAVLATALVLVVTWGLGADAGGAFFEVVALFNIAIVAVALGADTGLVRFTSRSLALDSAEGRQNRLLLVGLIPVLGLGVLVAAVAILLSPSLGRSLGGDQHAEAITNMIRVLAVFIPAGALNLAVLGATRGYGTMLPTVAAERVGRPAIQLILVGVAVLLGVSAAWLATAWAAGFLLSLIAGIAWLRRLRHRHESGPSPTKQSLGETIHEFWAFTLPRALASIFRVGVLWLDVILVGLLMSPRDVAIYTVATRIVQAGYLASDAIGQAVEPMFSSLLARGHADRTHNVYQVATSWLISLTWPLFLAALIFAPTILGLFGSDFTHSASVVAILAVSALVGCGFGSIDILLVMAGKSLWSLWNSGASLATNLALNLILIPSMGLTGAALAWAISRLLSNLLPFLQMNRLLGINPLGRRWGAAAGASVIAFGLIGVAMRLTLGGSVAVLVSYTVIAAAVYVGILWTWRRPLELTAFAGLIRGRIKRNGAKA